MTARSAFLTTLLCAAALAVTACGSTGSAVRRDTQASPETAAVRSVGEYRLGPDDELRITVFGEPDLSGEFSINGSGIVSLPLIGEVRALNLTASELESVAEEQYANGYLRAPRINVEVLNYRPFYILGEVGTPGEYPYTNGLTVMNAIATAGGFTYRANKKVVVIKEAEKAEEARVLLEPSTPVQPGDTIRVIERFF